MLKPNYTKIALLFVCMLFVLTFIVVSVGITSNLAYIPGHFMGEDFVKCMKVLGVIHGHI